MPPTGTKVLESATNVSVQVIARLLMLSERRVQQLVKEGVIPQAETRRYNLEESVQAYIQYIQGKNIGKSLVGEDDRIDFHVEKARLTKTQADKAEFELRQMAGELVLADDVIKVWEIAVTDCKSRLLSVPSKAAPIVATETNAGACQKIIDELVREALLELGQYGNSERESDNNGGDEGMDSASET